jgi:uncharacterized protein YybS (DUF2232 family)
MPIVLRLGLAVTVSSGLYAVGLSCAPAGMPFALLVPLPSLILATQARFADCAAWAFLTASVIGAGFGAEAAPGFLLPFGIPSLMMATGIRRFWSFERTTLAAVAAWTLGSVGLALLMFGDMGAVVGMAREQLGNSVDLALSTYSSMGASENMMSAVQVDRDALVRGLLEILPALVVLTGAFTVIANLMLLRSWTDISRDVNLRLWRTPDALIWGLIATGFGMFAPIPAIAVVARNLFIVVLGCYFCQGLAIVSYYLDRFRMPRGLRIVGYIVIALQHVATAMVLALGVFDLWGNFRRLGVGPADVSFHTDGE